MSADKDHAVRELLFREPRQVHDFGHVRQIITGEADRLGAMLAKESGELAALCRSRNVEPLNDVRTKLADFFNILPDRCYTPRA